MSIATLTSKGQTTIPQAIRSYLGLHAGDKIEFVIEESGRVILEPITADVHDLKGLLPKPKKIISVEEMKQAIIKRGSE